MTDDPALADDAPDDDEPDDDDGGLHLSWPAFVAFVVVVALAAGVAGYLLAGRGDPEAGSVDVGFYRDMTIHHEQAVHMAQLQMLNGDDPTIRGIAQEIIILQSQQIGVMRNQLETWGHSAAERPEVSMAWMGMGTAPESMPGMATEEEMADLEAARGAVSDALFLELMAEHHRGGVHMGVYAEKEAGEASVRRLANRIARSQALEVNEFIGVAERLGLDVSIEPMEVPPLAQ